MFETTPPKDVMNIKPFTASGKMVPTFQLLTRRDVQDYYQNIINTWEPITDVWAVRIAPICAGIVIAASGICVNQMFRQKFKMREIGLAISLFATGVGTPLVFSLVDRVSRRKILENNYCPLCMHARYAIIYPTFGLLFPLIASPAINLHRAEEAGFDVPQLHEIRKVGKVWWSVVKPAIPTLSLMCGALMVFGVFMSYHTMESIHWVHFVIAKMHEDYLKQYDKALEAEKEKNANSDN